MTTNWTIKRTTSPSELPVSLAEAKKHLRLNANDPTHDDNLTLLLTAATERLEQDIDRQILSASYQQTQFCWNETDDPRAEVKLFKKAVTAVTSVKSIDESGSEQTLDPSDYIFDAARGSLFPTGDSGWPSLKPNTSNAVTIDFTAGYGVDANCVPRLFKAAILLTVGKWFFDPAQEGSALHSQEVAYERIVTLLMRSSYP